MSSPSVQRAAADLVELLHELLDSELALLLALDVEDDLAPVHHEQAIAVLDGGLRAHRVAMR